MGEGEYTLSDIINLIISEIGLIANEGVNLTQFSIIKVGRVHCACPKEDRGILKKQLKNRGITDGQTLADVVEEDRVLKSHYIVYPYESLALIDCIQTPYFRKV